MKYYFLLSLLFFGLPSTAQFDIDWQVLDPLLHESITIKYVSEDDVMIGLLLYPSKLMISEDLGESWQELYTHDNFTELNNRLFVKQNPAGDYYFNGNEQIFQINSSGEAEEFVSFDERIWGFDFLPNGNLVVAMDREMYLFDSGGMQLQKVELTTIFRELLIGEGDQHYVGRFEGGTNVVLPFRSDFSDLASNDHIIAPINSGYVFSSGRLYSNFGYLDENNRWVNYQGNLNGTITILKNDDIHLIVSDRIYVSSDRGETFELESSSIGFTRNYAESSVLGNGVLLYNTTPNVCQEEQHRYSADGFEDWTMLDFEIGESIAFSVEASSRDAVYAGGCSYVSHFSLSEGEPWSTFDPENVSCEEIRSLVSTPTGNLVTSARCYSDNGGLDWTSNNSDEFFNVFYKNGRSFVVNWDQVFLSEDEGVTWSTYTLDFSALPFGEWMAVDVSEDGLLYFSNYENVVVAYNLAGEVETAIELEGYFYSDLATSSTGRELYILQQKTDEHLLTSSIDGGISFDTIDVSTIISPGYGGNVRTDHLGNVYLNGRDRLFISQDKGITWSNISPGGTVASITDFDVSWDNYIYLATLGQGVIRSAEPLAITTELTVFVYNDSDNNCELGQAEDGMQGMIVSIGDSRYVTNAKGELNIPLQNGNYELALASRSDLYSSCLGAQDFIIDDTQGNLRIELPVYIMEECADLEISSTTPFLRRCFENFTIFTIRNEGSTEATNVELEVILDPFYDFLDSDATVSSIQDSVLILEVGNIEARGQHIIRIWYDLSCEAELGKVHYMNASVTHADLCPQTLGEGHDLECRENIGSFDPNDKQVYIEGILGSEIVGEDSEIEYLIRFQNTGTDTAFTVRIEDALSQDFDISTVVPIAASHNYTWKLEDGKLTVLFENILLVDSLTNEQDSHGFVRLRAELMDTRPEPGAIIDNTAEIFFDFNEPIRTNTIESYYLCKGARENVELTICSGEVVDIAGTVLSETGEYVIDLKTGLGCDSVLVISLTVLDDFDVSCMQSSTDELTDTTVDIYPNPSTGMVTVYQLGESLYTSYRLCDNLGAMVRKGVLSSSTEILNLNNLTDGLYFIELMGKDGKKTVDKIVVTR